MEWLLLVVTAGLQFFRLGMGDILQWDESLYAIRSEACLKFGAWFDQTAYSAGGLYSSTHPPLGVWMIAAGKYLFGDTTYALRFSAALCAVIAIFLFYKICRLFFDEHVSLIGAIIFGNAQIFLWYGHHAQLDVPMHAFILVCIYFTLHHIVREGNKDIFYAGLAIGVALLIKAFQALYIIPFLIGLSILYSEKYFRRSAISIVGIGIATALPWYIFMAISHGTYILDWQGLFTSLASGSYAGGEHTQPWYYFNQAVINYPFSVAIIAIPIVSFIKNVFALNSLKNHEKLFAALILWFVTMLIVLTVMKTRFPHFILFFSIPSSLITVYILDSLSKDRIGRIRSWLSLFLMFIGLLWSESEDLRLSIKGFNLDPHFAHLSTLIPIVLALLLLLGIILSAKKALIQKIILMLVAALVVGNVYRWSQKSETVFISGVKDVVNVLEHDSGVKNILLLHNGAPHEEMLPQFAYYSGGWNLNWNSSRRSTTMTWGEGKSLFASSTIPHFDAIVVNRAWDRYYVPPQDEVVLLANLDSLLRMHYSRVLITRQYLLYRR